MLNRRAFLKSSGLAAAAAFFAPQLATADRRELFTPIRRGTGTFEGRGGTIGWYISEDAVVLIDSQFPDTAADCLAGVQRRSSRNIDYLINSHHHGDHTAGNPTLAPHADQVVAQENVPELQRASAERSNRLDGQVYATTLYSTEWRADLGDETVHAKYYGPAHTGGDSVIHFQNADVAHTGDLIFNRVPCYIDLAGGSDTERWISVLESIHDDFTDETIFVFGHSHPDYSITGSREDILEARDFLTALREHVQKGVAAGNSVDELLVTTLPGFESYLMQDRPETLHGRIRSVFTELSGS